MKPNTSKIVIRKARPSDVIELITLIHKLFQQWKKHGRSEALDEKYFRSKKIIVNQTIWLKENLVYVAIVNKKIIGFISAEIINRPKIYKIKKDGHITLLYIEPDYRKKGIGIKLLQEIHKNFKSKKIKHITTSTHALDIKAKKFWNKQGYTNYNITLSKI